MNGRTSPLNNTFPEVEKLIGKWWKSSEDFEHITDINEKEEAIKKSQKDSIVILFKFCQKKYPPHFFEILDQNNDIFNQDSDIDTEFLPHIHFKDLWHFDISDKTRETIWKYLQSILFSVIGTVHNSSELGDTAKLFEAIDEEELKKKLEETLEGMQNIFDASGCTMDDGIDASFSGINMENMRGSSR